MSARDLTAGVAAAIAAGTVRPALFFEGEYVAAGSPDAAYLRLWSGLGTLQWDGKTWTGAGNLGAISPIEETSQLKAVGFTATLSGMPSESISIALSSLRQGRPGTVWLGFFDSAGALIADPYQLQRGLLDVAVIEDDGTTCTIALQYESRLLDLERPRARRYTPEDQAIDYPSDTGFRWVAGLQDGNFVWQEPPRG